MGQYGELLDIDIGYISRKVLPGVTIGTWTVKDDLDRRKVSAMFCVHEGGG